TARDIIRMCVSLGGVLTGEHGVGMEKNELMPLLFSDADFDLMRRVHDAFNPDSSLNPGKIFPITKAAAKFASANPASARPHKHEYNSRPARSPGSVAWPRPSGSVGKRITCICHCGACAVRGAEAAGRRRSGRNGALCRDGKAGPGLLRVAQQAGNRHAAACL